MASGLSTGAAAFALVVLANMFGELGATPPTKPPNIVFIVADDLGHADIGYNNPYMKTPVIDELARSGVTLTQSYVQPLCTASRNAFLTGRYPFRTGMQHGAIIPASPSCVPGEFKLLPQYLKGQGYATHIVGKWHLGFCNWNCTPTHRGFDTFFGPFNGQIDYFTHEIQGYQDLRDNETPVINNTEYSTNLFTKRAVKVIEDHNANDPLFLYLPYTSPHIPVQAPEEYRERCADIVDENRRTFCGMVAAMDDGIGKVVDALRAKNIYEDTIIAFTTDNGGWQPFSGYNWPYRGQKMTIYEGGTRGPAWIHSPLLKTKGVANNEMFHAVDWFATFLKIAGITPPDGVDGLDQTDMLLNGGKTKRTEFVYNLDDTLAIITQGNAAIRLGDYKLIQGLACSPGQGGWYTPPEYVQSKNKSPSVEPIQSFSQWLNKTRADGGELPDRRLWEKFGPPRFLDQLYNLKEDPEERNNLAHSPTHWSVVEQLKARLDEYRKGMVKPIFPPSDPASNPQNFGNVWTPGWC